jgi:hypothetical protein
MRQGRFRLQGGLGEEGFSLAEILIACFLTSVGLVAAASGFGMGVQGVETGRQQTTAVFLAEQRIDDAKALAAAAPNLTLVTLANLPDEAYGAIPGAARYRRAVTIAPFVGPGGGLPPGTQGSRVDVRVFYRPVTGWGVLSAERQVQLSVFLARR